MKTMNSTANSVFADKLEWLWSLMDISENLAAADKTAAKVGNDLITSGIHFAAFLMLSVVTGALAWHFDFESTIVGVSTLQNAVLPGLPSSAQQFSTFIAFGFGIAPTLIEIFTAAFARAQIKILQIFVVGLTAFDMVTDIPRALSFTNSLNKHFDTLGPLIGGFAHWVFFILWLFLSTIGFELGFIIFIFLTIIFFFKMLNLRKQGYTALKITGNGNKAPQTMKPTIIEA